MTNLSLTQILEKIIGSDRHFDQVQIIAIDGPAGSGKTTLASRITSALETNTVQTIHKRISCLLEILFCFNSSMFNEPK